MASARPLAEERFQVRRRKRRYPFLESMSKLALASPDRAANMGPA